MEIEKHLILVSMEKDLLHIILNEVEMIAHMRKVAVFALSSVTPHNGHEDTVSDQNKIICCRINTI